MPLNGTEQEYINRSIVIKNETVADANSAQRVGSLLEDAYTYIFNLLGTINTSGAASYVTPYIANKQYAFDLNNPFAVLFPNSSNVLRIWVLKPTVDVTLKLRNTPSYASTSEWIDLGLSDIANHDRVKNAVQYSDLVEYLDANETKKAPNLKFFTEKINELSQRITNANNVIISGDSVLTAVEYFYIYNQPVEGDIVDPTIKYINEVNRTVTLANEFFKIIDLIFQDVNGEAVSLGFDDDIPSNILPIPLYSHSTSTDAEYAIALRPTADPTGSLTRVEVHYHYLAQVDDEGTDNPGVGPAIPPYNNLELYQYGQEPKFVWHEVTGKVWIWTLKNTINTQQNETRTPPSFAENSQWQAVGYDAGSGGISNITGLISQGTNVTITGTGTSADPYVINSSGSSGFTPSGTAEQYIKGNGTYGSISDLKEVQFFEDNAAFVAAYPGATPDNVLFVILDADIEKRRILANIEGIEQSVSNFAYNPFLGEFLSLSDINTAYPTGAEGKRFATFRPNNATPAKLAIWNPTLGWLEFQSGTTYTLPDASTTTKGGVKISVEPEVATEPIVVGNNDPRLQNAYTDLPAAPTTTWNTQSKFINKRTTTLNQNITLAFSNLVNGAEGTWIVTQDNIGGRTIAFPVGSLTSGVFINNVANGVTALGWTYDGSRILWTSKAY